MEKNVKWGCNLWKVWYYIIRKREVEIMLKYNIYIGLNDKELLKQIIDTTKARKMVYQTLLKNGIVAYTIYLVNGVFTNEVGKITKEKTLKIEVLDTKKK